MQCTVKTPQTLINNEFYIKKCIVVAGVLYWLYGMMPIVDELFNVITLVALAYIFLFFCKRKPGGRFGTTPGQNMQCGAGFTGSAKHCPAPGLH